MNLISNLLGFIRSLIHIKVRGKPIKNIKEILKKWHNPSKPKQRSRKPLITWIGHSTFLIQIANINIVTDPIFFPLSRFFPRIIPPGIPLENLPPIDVLLISHDHLDHMEKSSLRGLAKHNPIALVPCGLGKHFHTCGFKKIVENKHGDTYKIAVNKNEKLVFTFLPAAHWSFTTHGSWMIEEKFVNSSIYFAGDSAYDKHFIEIAQSFPKIGPALLPIGPLEPRHIEQHNHLDSKQALQAFFDLKAKQFIPMHWGTFIFGSESFEEPILLLKSEWNKYKKNIQENLKNKTLSILKFGKQNQLIF